MRRQRLVQLTLVLVLAAAALALLVVGVRAASRPSQAAAVHIPPQVWQATADGGEAEFLVVLREQAQLDHVASISDRDARLHAVYDALRFTALSTQRSLRAELDAAGVSYRAFYIVNMLLVKGDRALLARLATRSDVVGISANPRTRQAMPVSQALAASSAAPSAVAWGVQSISATLVWSQGYTGTGIVVAGADTGYAWEHPALIRQYRGYDGITATHDYNWH
ncbi:MAG: hypothetical protein GX601_03285, partial [Anaerolineales bacterium]|nr:hypothetical protein [Anaerolineales bacterium]